MFSRNRYGRKAMLDTIAGTNLDLFWHEKNIKHDSVTGLIYKYDLVGVDEYYSDDKFYSEHVVGDEWFAKERREYEAGLWNPYFDYLASRMKPELPVLDVGCGAGWFMDYWMKRNRFNAFGIEPSQSAREYVNNLNPFIFESIDDFRFYLDDLESITGRTIIESFNVLMSLTLEHIPDPVSFIQQYLPYVGKNGTLTIVVPNDFSPLQQWIGSTHFIQDVHVNYFTPDSLENVIYEALPESKHPMKYELFMSATFPMELFEVFGIHYINNPKIGAKCHKFRLLFEKFLQKRAFELYEKLFDRYGWGRELVYSIRMLNT